MSCCSACAQRSTTPPRSRFDRRRPPRSIGDTSLTSSATTALTAQVQAKLSSASGDAATWVQSNTGVDVTNARTAQGAADAASLAANGFNPNSEGDRQKMVGAIAGGLALIPAVGPVLALALETLYQVSEVAACPVMNFMADIGVGTRPPSCGGAPCWYTGTPSTPAQILADTRFVPPTGPAGPCGRSGYPSACAFAEIATGALAQFASLAMSCQASLPPDTVIDALVAIWNRAHQGPSVSVFVPPLKRFGSTSLAPVAVPIFAATAGSPAITYAFSPDANIPADVRWLLPLTSVLYGWATPMRTIAVNLGPPIAAAPVTKIVPIHFGAPTSSSPFVTKAAPAATAASSGPGPVAVLIGASAVAALAWTAARVVAHKAIVPAAARSRLAPAMRQLRRIAR